MKYKLNFELVPDSCWYSNLRSILKPAQWDIIRKDAYAKANEHCSICGRLVKRLEAHEYWDYDEEHCIQKLTDVIAVCNQCHSVIHIGRTQLLGNDKDASDWFIKVNNCSYAEYRKALGQANIDHQRRNLVSEWQLDLTWLNNKI